MVGGGSKGWAQAYRTEFTTTNIHMSVHVMYVQESPSAVLGGISDAVYDCTQGRTKGSPSGTTRVFPANQNNVCSTKFLFFLCFMFIT
jgi:hypothetical protein